MSVLEEFWKRQENNASFQIIPHKSDMSDNHLAEFWLQLFPNYDVVFSIYLDIF